MMFYSFLLLLGCISYSSYASFEAAVAKHLRQACVSKKQKPQVPAPQPLAEPKAQTKQTELVSQADLIAINGAKQLIRAMHWEQTVKAIIEIFDKVGFVPDIRRLIVGYFEKHSTEEKYDQLITIRTCSITKDEYYYPVQQLAFTDDRTSVMAAFDCCTQKKYQENRKRNPKYWGSGMQWYWINKVRTNNAYIDNDPISGCITAEEFEQTMPDPLRLRVRRLNPNFTYNFYDPYRIQDSLVATTSDDDLLKAQVEDEYSEHVSEHAREKYPNKVLIEPQFGARQISISVGINMGKLLKVILMPSFLETLAQLEQRNNGCVIS